MTDVPSPLLPADRCTLVKWHTRQKHEFLREYLDVWAHRVGSRKGVVAPTLEIVDLYSSRGWCRANPSTEHGAPTDPWPGTAVLAARALAAYRRPKRLVLNSFEGAREVPGPSQIESLKTAIAAELGPTPAFPVEFLNDEVALATERACKLVDPKFPSIWILDPQVAEDLPWSVVERIANFTGEYRTPRENRTVVRRPEVFITLITEGLQRNVDRAPRSVDSALGLPESEWRPLLKDLSTQGLNVRQSLIYLYAERLFALYNHWPAFIEVDSSHGNIVYANIFASSTDPGAYMAKKVAATAFKDWKRSEWIPTARLVSKNRRIILKDGSSAPMQRNLTWVRRPRTGSGSRELTAGFGLHRPHREIPSC